MAEGQVENANMLRIVETNEILMTTVSLQGKLLISWVPEVRTAVSAALTRGGVYLDLANLLFADAAGIQLLRELVDCERVQLKATSPFLAALLAAIH
jgi:anti-anti-sigma regulatory factor